MDSFVDERDCKILKNVKLKFYLRAKATVLQRLLLSMKLMLK